MEQLKEVKLVFCDYSADSFALANALISKVNLYKKTNIMEIFLQAKELIPIKEIQKFKKYVTKRFNLKDVILKISTSQEEKDVSGFIYNEWNDILSYLSQKAPIIKAFMKNSTSKILDNDIEVELSVKGKEFLEKQKIDNYISEFLKDTYGGIFKVKFKENKVEQTEKNFDEEKKRIIEDYARNSTRVLMRKAKKSEEGFEEDKTKEKKQNFTPRNPSQGNTNNFQNNNSNSLKNNNGSTGNYNNSKMEDNEDASDNKPSDPNLIYGRNTNMNDPVTKVEDIGMDTTNVLIVGEIVNVPDPTELKKTGKFLYSFDVYDGTSTITCKIFALPEKKSVVDKRLKPGVGVKVKGRAGYDNFAKEITILANTVLECELPKKTARMDNAPVKRVELHMHTQMSQMDAVTPATELIKRAMKWGMKSIAITDHGVVQSFPDAHKLLDGMGYDKTDMKVIYGVEGYLVPDKKGVITKDKGQTLEDTTYCVFDLETTGISFRTEKITEIGIMKVRNGEVIDQYSSFVNPEKPIPMKVQEITNITDEMVKDAPTIEEILPKNYKSIARPD